MINLVVGAPRNLEERDIEYAMSLLSDSRFTTLVQDTADALVLEWSTASTVTEREAAWSKLEALRAILSQLQNRADHGLLLAEAVRKSNRSKGDTNA